MFTVPCTSEGSSSMSVWWKCWGGFSGRAEPPQLHLHQGRAGALLAPAIAFADGWTSPHFHLSVNFTITIWINCVFMYVS